MILTPPVKPQSQVLGPVNSIARWQPTATGNPPAATLIARCVADFPPIPFPNHPVTAP